MNKNKNYYAILGISNGSNQSEIKKKYYSLSVKNHPDKGGSAEVFSEINEAYSILSNKELREEYDLKSKFGNNYNEYFELFDVKVEYDYEKQKDNLEKFKKNEVYNIKIDIGDDFNGCIEYERWVKCRGCDGTGKDLSSKIVIKDVNGNITKVFDADDGCDFCDGTGKDYRNVDCSFCAGKGKVGITPCGTCGGEKRILGKQKLNKIKLSGTETKIDAMGHFSKDGKIGYLLLFKKI